MIFIDMSNEALKHLAEILRTIIIFITGFPEYPYPWVMASFLNILANPVDRV